jgi:hypothetical protein
MSGGVGERERGLILLKSEIGITTNLTEIKGLFFKKHNE